MPRIFTNHARKSGLPPGTAIHIGERRVEKTTISVIDYDEKDLHERILDKPEPCAVYANTETVTWINVAGLQDVDILRCFSSIFGFHPLVLEDVLNTGQRPKLEDHGTYLFVVLKMLYRHAVSGDIVAEQVSLVLGHNFVLSVQEIEGDVFDAIRDRIRTAKGRIRKMGADYLAYSLLDAIVDNYFVVLEDVGENIENLQEDVLRSTGPETMQTIQRLKYDMIFMRKSLWPLREVVSTLEKLESPLVGEELGPYLRDVYEHTIHVIDSIELLRDMLSGSLDLYMTSISNRMNEIMKVLTIIATVFIPLTFIAGVYGMNFDHMPELHWRLGYAAAWLVMLATAGVMWAYFRKKKWL